jgi:hypothetical protein
MIGPSAIPSAIPSADPEQGARGDEGPRAGAYGVSAEVAANAAVPTSSSFLRPIRSSMPPMVTRSPASANPHASAIQRICVPDGARSSMRLGMARWRAPAHADRSSCRVPMGLESCS